MPGGTAAAAVVGGRLGLLSLRRLRITSQKMRKTTRPIAAIPPTTPPTMAPTGVELLSVVWPPPPPPPPGVVVVAEEVLVVEEEDDRLEREVATARFGGVASRVSKPPWA
jgi:hypothetical protein